MCIFLPRLNENIPVYEKKEKEKKGKKWNKNTDEFVCVYFPHKTNENIRVYGKDTGNFDLDFLSIHVAQSEREKKYT